MWLGIIFFLVIIGLIAELIWRKKKSIIARLWYWAWDKKAVTTGIAQVKDISVSFQQYGTITLSVDVDLTKLNKTDRDFIGDIVDKMQKRQMENKK